MEWLRKYAPPGALGMDFYTYLPVLAKGDLRELQQSWPVLHLHRVHPAAIDNMSNLDRTNLTNVIAEKLESLFLSQRKSPAEQVA